MFTMLWGCAFIDYIEKQDEKTVKILLEGKVSILIYFQISVLKIIGGLIAYMHCFLFK